MVALARIQAGITPCLRIVKYVIGYGAAGVGPIRKTWLSKKQGVRELEGKFLSSNHIVSVVVGRATRFNERMRGELPGSLNKN